MGDLERGEFGTIESLQDDTSVTEAVPGALAPAGASAPIAPGLDELGQMVREARKKKGWTLEETGRHAGIGRSTLSKIENGLTSPGFDIVRRLTQSLELETPNLFLQSGKSDLTGRRDVTRKGEGETKVTATYSHELLCNELTSKAMLPYVSTIKARDISDFGDWIRHRGEEFMFVLSGELELHTEHYRPLAMKAGDSVYYDSSMGHCCVTTSKEDAVVLWVSLER
ncbi:cupin domain-containing protein [uncultured Cohaesibacter sp.]|uniref:helix-turn-helix domain-containing protein n=1 Tax=uncultured Cohaesibacter sp. TaxID=1002546 RepID=UPI0029C8E36F|nr:cupin domain-containing protein [uncultured Cohaesibacter sp.]